MGIDALGSRDDHNFDTNEGEGRVYERSEEPEEVSRWSCYAVVIYPCARIVPISEANSLTVWCTSSCNDDCNEDKTEEARNLDCSRDHFGLAKEADAQEVTYEDKNKTDGDHNGRRQIGPVADENCGC